MSGSASRPAVVSYEEVLDTEEAAKQRLDFFEKVEKARQMPTPAWVTGPRPSDECLALLDDPGDLGDISRKSFNIQVFYDLFQPAKSLNFICSQLPAEFKAEKVHARGVDCYWASWPGITSSMAKEGMVLYIHGGAFIGGHPFVDWCAQFSRITRKPVLSVDYRKPPEHPFPDATLDVVSIYQWLIEDQLVPPGKIAIYGQSAGGTLTLLTLQEIARQSLRLPACGCPVSAFGIYEKTLACMPNLIAVTIGNEDANGEDTGKHADPLDEKYNFLAGTFVGLPPLFVMVGDREFDRDREVSLKVADVAKNAGVRVELCIVPGMQHLPDEYLPRVPESVEACTRAAAFIDDCFGYGRNSQNGSWY